MGYRGQVDNTNCMKNALFLKNKIRDFPGGAVVKNPPANVGDTDSSPGPGTYNMLRSN